MNETTNAAQSNANVSCIESTNINMKFFNNPLFCANLREYLAKEYTVDYWIPSQPRIDNEIGISIELSGAEVNVKRAWDYIKALFQTVKTKIFNSENSDKKVMYWSKNIYSDSAINIIQRIFDNEKLFTVWEKTDILSGYYVVHYFNSNHTFDVSELCIDRIINNDISYVKDIVIPKFDCIQTNFSKELDKFFNDKKQQQQQLQTFSIIYCKYPFQTELKISFFGQKIMVNNAKKQLQRLLYKHEMKTINIELDSTQREYLLDNCVPQLRDIESEYKGDNVKIQIRENLFYAPQYLTLKIKRMITNLIFKQVISIFKYIQNDFILTTKQNLEIEQIARKYNCQIEKIDVQTNNELIELPQLETTSTIQSTSKFIIQQSNEFSNTRTMLKRLSTLTGGIEIHKTNNSTLPMVDITIISVVTDAQKEQIESNCTSFFVEQDTHRKLLFIPWLPPSTEINNDQMEIILQNSVKEFISNSLTQIEALCTNNVKRIAFSTTEWQNYSNRKQLIEQIIYQLKYQLETNRFSNHNWTILFIFDENQSDLYNLFSQTILQMQLKNNDYEQFYFPITTIKIHLKTSQNSNIVKGQNAINVYFQKHLIKTVELDDAFDSKIWNQYMINVYYKYAIEQFVLPTFYCVSDKQKGTERYRLHLTGSPTAVYQMQQRYNIMSEIIKQKTLLSIQMNEQIEITNSDQFQQPKLNDIFNKCNIEIICCPEDEILSNQLADHLTDEGYLVCVNHSNQLSSFVESSFENTDVILVYFTGNYLKNENCLAHINLAKMSKKKIIAIVPMTNRIDEDNNWLHSITIANLYYELFREEIHFKLDEHFGFEYDKLLVELLHYTKLGRVGQTYSIQSTKSNQEEQVSYEENFQPQITIEQRRQREQIYEKNIQQIIDRDRIPTDELDKIMKSLRLVIEDCKNGNLSDIDYEKLPEEQSNQPNEHQQNEIDLEREQMNRDEGLHYNSYMQQLLQTIVYKKNKNLLNSYSSTDKNYERDNKLTQRNLNDLVLCIERWMNKASNGTIIRGNIPPFTLTGDFNDVQYPMLLLDKNPWWTTNITYSDFDHSPSNIYFRYPPLIMGSPVMHNQAHHYYQTLIDKDIIFQNETRKQRRIMIKELQEKNEQMKSNKLRQKLNRKTSKVLHNSKFTTELKQDQIAWDITQDRLILNEYNKRRTKNNTNKSLENLSGWERILQRSIQLLSDIKQDKIELNSDIIQGKIGDQFKTQEEIQKLNQLDDPNNKRWTIKEPRRCTREFIQAKIQNITQFKELCGTSSNM